MNHFTRSGTTRARRGLTLIEVLLVLGIIGILVLLFMPATRRVRESAARTQCSNNLRQIGVALSLYNDVNKRFPSAGETIDSATGNPFGYGPEVGSDVKL